MYALLKKAVHQCTGFPIHSHGCFLAGIQTSLPSILGFLQVSLRSHSAATILHKEMSPCTASVKKKPAHGRPEK
jgi:hypothetical protein